MPTGNTTEELRQLPCKLQRHDAYWELRIFLIGQEQMTVQRSDWEDLTLQTTASLFTSWDDDSFTSKDKKGLD
jgi:hypothetical protein